MTPILSSAHLLRAMRSTSLRTLLADGSLGTIEKCGLLRGRGREVTRFEETRNVSPSPRERFEIDPAALLRAHRLQRAPGGLALLGFWHTHPHGDAVPSPRDAACAAPDGRLWLVANRTRATLWRACGDGILHGRFDPLPFDLRIGKRIDRDVPGVQMRGADGAFTMIVREPPR